MGSVYETKGEKITEWEQEVKENIQIDRIFACGYYVLHRDGEPGDSGFNCPLLFQI